MEELRKNGGKTRKIRENLGRLGKTWGDCYSVGSKCPRTGGIFLRENLKVTKIKTVAAVRNTFFSSRKSRG